MLILSRHDVESLLTMPDTIAAVEEGFRQLYLGHVEMPQRLATRIETHNGLHLSMPAFVGGDPGASGTLTIKVVTVYGDNRARYGLPTIHGVLLLHDARTGRPVALMDAEHLTAMRTGAASGVATKHMARHDASVVTLFGAGAQAGPQLMAVCAVRPIRQIYVVTHSGARDAAFSTEMAQLLGVPVTPAHDVRAAVEAADIICTATNSSNPLFDGNWLAEGVHINAVGSYMRTMRELDTTTVRRSRLIVDHPQAAQTEAGEIVIPMASGELPADHVAGALGAVVAGALPGRTSSAEITLFKSVGLAMQDAMTAAIVYNHALEQERGQEIAL